MYKIIAENVSTMLTIVKLNPTALIRRALEAIPFERK
jgi:hypothetical protein